jgi:hypothetical protein
MQMLIQFLADMLNDKPTPQQATARSSFARDPEAAMEGYGLSAEQKDAIRSRDLTKVVDALSSELDRRGKQKPNW